MDPLHESQLQLTRRHFFGRTATGIGTAALAGLLERDGLAGSSGQARIWRAARVATFCAQSETCHLLVSERRADPRRSV